MINKQNHDIFRQIYGDYEYERLKTIFEIDRPGQLVKPDWPVPELDDTSYTTRLVFFAGVGSMSYIEAILKTPKINTQVSSFVFIENDDRVIADIVNHPNFIALVNNPYIRFMFKQDKDNFCPNLFRILKLPTYSEVMELGCVYFNQVEQNEVYKKFYTEIDGMVGETVTHIYHNYGRIDDSIEGIAAVLGNRKRLLDCPGIQDLKGKYAGLPAMVIGAGPSLDEELDNIRANNDKFVIFAADAAVKALLKHGIRVDFCTSIERGNIYQKPFWTDLDPKETQLICFPVVHPEVLDLYKGSIRIAYRNYSYFAYFENAWPKGILHSGGSTSNLAIRLAHYMGCSSITLVGIDNAYLSNGNGLYRSHCANTGYPEWSEWREKDYFMNHRQHQPPFLVEGNDGQPTLTNATYYQWSKEFAEEVINLNLPISVTASFGVKMADILYKKLTDVCKDLKDIEHMPSPASPNPIFHRRWEHSVIIESVEGWIRTADDMLKIINSDKLDNQIMQYIADIHELRYIKDDLFISFVIQNCAVEYYRLQNRFNGLRANSETYLKDKLAVYKERFELYKQVTEKLLKAFKENESGQ